MRTAILTIGLLFLGAPIARAAETRCGLHQHEAVEQNDDEGGTVKRCVCDDGWDADGPGAPCKKVKTLQPKKK
jgi:hypothetical protein